MKTRLLFLVISFCLSSVSFSQVPELFNYQAIPRNSSGGVYPDQAMTGKFSILEGSISGTPVYIETFSGTTTSLGILNLIIGQGTVISGSLNNIEWGNNSFYLKVEIDVTGGVDYVTMGTTRLVSVPYALYAQNADTADTYFETDPQIGSISSGYSPKWSGTELVTGEIFQDGSGNVGIGTTSPDARLEVNGEIISANRAYGMAYRTSSFDCSCLNCLCDVPLNGGNGSLMNISHSTSTNPEILTVNVGGTFLIHYNVHFRRAGSNHHLVARLCKNTQEIPGSFAITSLFSGNANENDQLTSQAITTLSAGDNIKLQIGSNVNVTPEVDVYDDDNLFDPDTRIYAIVTVLKIGP